MPLRVNQSLLQTLDLAILSKTRECSPEALYSTISSILDLYIV